MKQGKKSKKDKISLGITIGIWVVAAVLIVLAVFSKQLFGEDSFFNGLFGGGDGVTLWDKVIAFAPSLLKAVIMAIIIYAIGRLVREILKLCLSRGKRGLTVVKLADSFIKYVVAIIIVIMILSVFGVDTATLLASAGILGLVIGLGAQSLIGDIIAGLFIVFEGDYNVGDIVVVDGWRGTVQEIGIRTTKIMDAGGNTKIINNSEISSIINMTNELSLASCEVGIEYGESIERVEMVIKKSLDDMKERIPAIVEGPYYKGVKTLNSSSVDLLFAAKCKENDIYQVQRDMNREIKIIFDKNNINIPFPQIVLNQPIDFKGVTEKTREKANAFVDEQKEASKNVEEKQ